MAAAAHAAPEHAPAKRASSRAAGPSPALSLPRTPVVRLDRSACACGGGCPSCRRERTTAIQTSLDVSTPGDVHEREADRVADQVMRMAAPRGAAPPAVPAPARHRPQTSEEQVVRRTERAEPARPPIDAGAGARIDALRGGGQPLPPSVRAFFEPRFGYDFGAVRAHADARAFTVGRDIAFAAGEYQPHTPAGRHLIAHELAHVAQQGGAAQAAAAGLHVGRSVGAPMIQRACGRSAITAALATGSAPSCIGMSGDVTGERFRFRINCDDFASRTEENRFNLFLRGIRPGDFFKVHGFASRDGDMGYNLDLSCARARKAATMIAAAGGVVTDVIAFGPTDGPAAERRSVVITPTLIPGGESSPACPHGVRAVNIALFLLPGSTRNAFADLAFANRVFADCCVRFDAGMGGSLAVPGWTDNVLDHSNNCSDLSAEEQEMFDAAVANGAGADVWVFYVENYTPNTGSKGLSCHPGSLGGNHAVFPPSVYIRNDADPGTFAHEMGHILLQSGTHHGLVDPSDPNNLMQQREARGQRVTLDRIQCGIIFTNAGSM